MNNCYKITKINQLVEYQSDFNRKKGWKVTLAQAQLGLMIELAELFNEDEDWKYWKNNKNNISEKWLSEFADVLHFLFMVIDLSNTHLNDLCEYPYYDRISIKYRILERIPDIGTKNWLSISILTDCIFYYAKLCGFTFEQVVEAYYKKNKINDKRF